MFCKRCRYNLKMIQSGSCPECGRAFDVGDAKTYRKSVGWPKGVRRCLQGMGVIFVFSLIALGVIEVRYQREMAAANVLEKMGADVLWSGGAHQWARRIPILHERLQSVEKVRLVHAGLSSLPPEMAVFTQLNDLDLSGNNLSAFPPELLKHTKLQWLNLSNNQITSVPTTVGAFANLGGLLLSGNQISVLPAEIGNLTKLTQLSLDNNRVRTLPPQIGNLSNLIYLDLLSNQLISLPPEIGKLKALWTLVLGDNQLSILPSDIGKLTTISELDLHKNHITDAELKHLNSMTNLNFLSLSGTNVTRQGVTSLRLALPNCRIESDFDQPAP